MPWCRGRRQAPSRGSTSPRIHFRVKSTHSLGVDTAIEMARALGRLPGHISVYGVEGTEFGVGADRSEDVAAAVPVAAEMILEEITSAAD